MLAFIGYFMLCIKKIIISLLLEIVIRHLLRYIHIAKLFEAIFKLTKKHYLNVTFPDWTIVENIIPRNARPSRG